MNNLMPNKIVLHDEVLRTFASTCKWLARLSSSGPEGNVLAVSDSFHYIACEFMYPEELHVQLDVKKATARRVAVVFSDLVPGCDYVTALLLQNPDTAFLSEGYPRVDDVLSQVSEGFPYAKGIEILEFPLVGKGAKDIVRMKEDNKEHGGYIPFRVRIWVPE